MEEMRVQIEAREPTDGEIRAFWFTLPIDTEQVDGCRIKNGLVKKRNLQTMVQCHRE